MIRARPSISDFHSQAHLRVVKLLRLAGCAAGNIAYSWTHTTRERACEIHIRAAQIACHWADAHVGFRAVDKVAQRGCQVQAASKGVVGEVKLTQFRELPELSQL